MRKFQALIISLVDINVDDFFSFSNSVVTRGHQYKLYKKRTVSHVRAILSLANGLSMFGTLLQKMSILVHCCDLSAVFYMLIFLVL